MAKYAEIVDGVIASISFEKNSGLPEVPDTVFPGDIDNGDGTFSRPTPPQLPPTNSQINAERDRRIEEGEEFTLSDGTVIPMTGRQPDKDVLLARLIVASQMVAAGVTAPVLVFRDRSNVNHMLTPAQMVELVELGLAWFEAMMIRSWEMKDGTGDYSEGIPADFDQDSHWPTP